MDANGLRTFSLHAQNVETQPAMEVLRAERPSSPGFAVAEAIGLRNLDPESAARQHLQQALASEALPGLEAPQVNGADSEFKSLGTESLPLTDTRTVKFRQTYNKIPVYGSLVTVELTPDNELLALRSSLGDPTNVDSVAQISPSEALKAVSQATQQSPQLSGATPRLSFYFDNSVRRWRLVYILEDVPVRSRRANGAEGHSPLLMDYVVDAHSGEMVAELPRTPSVTWEAATRKVEAPGAEGAPTFAAGPGTADAADGLGMPRSIRFIADATGRGTLNDRTLNVATFDFRFRDLDSSPLPGIPVTNPPAPWQASAVSAHFNAAEVAGFLRSVLARNGIDNSGGPLISSVNCVVADESPDGRQWRNAAWVGTQMVYGQRAVDGGLRSYAVALDVVAHEIFHGVTGATARLEYVGETGALNESYSDIFGILISNFAEPDISRWNWEMGEELDGTGIPIRDFSEPRRRNQPDHMRDFRHLPNDRQHDSGGVHFNSGIHNKAAFNLITSRDSHGVFLFTPTSLAALFYLALSQYLSRTSLFSDSRAAIELVAQTLFRTDAQRADKLRAIAAAFDAVGILQA
jgi:Zn-dependent metalloprotease